MTKRIMGFTKAEWSTFPVWSILGGLALLGIGLWLGVGAVR